MAVQNSIYQVLSSFGKSLVAAVDAAAARVQLGLGSIATQNANAVAITGGSASGLSSVVVSGTTPSVSPQTGAAVVAGGLGVGMTINAGGVISSSSAVFCDTGLSGLLLARNGYDNFAQSCISGLYCDRLKGATARYSVTSSSNVTGSPALLFDKSINTRCTVPAGQTGWVEVDLTSNGNAVRGYWSGTYTITFQSTVSQRPESFVLEIQDGNNQWTTIASSTINKNVYVIQDKNGVYGRACKKLKLSWTAKAAPSLFGGVMFWEFHPTRPDNGEPELFLSSASATPQTVYGSMRFLGKDNDGLSALISPGSLSLSGQTVGQLQAITGQPNGSIAYCTNESGGAVPVFYDGTNWRRMTDRAIIT